MTMAKKKTDDEILYVSICEGKPNAMFTEQQRQSIRFLIYNKPVVCAECGKKFKKMWTMLCQFTAPTMANLVMAESGKSHLPLTPVCNDHLLAPDWTHEKNKTKIQK
jgi:hypothetical protein